MTKLSLKAGFSNDGASSFHPVVKRSSAGYSTVTADDGYEGPKLLQFIPQNLDSRPFGRLPDKTRSLCTFRMYRKSKHFPILVGMACCRTGRHQSSMVHSVGEHSTRDFSREGTVEKDTYDIKTVGPSSW